MASCVIPGDSDLFGLGVRLGVYLTGLSSLLSRLLCFTRSISITSSLSLLSFVLIIALVKNILTDNSPAMLNLYLINTMTHLIIMILSFSGGGSGSLASGLITVLLTLTQYGVLWIAWGEATFGIRCIPRGLCTHG
jgi:hypothetical protein